MNTEEKINYIYEHYGKLMHQKANAILHDSHEAEDAVQEAMLRLFRIAGRIEDPSEAKARILALTVTKNIAIDLWRKKAHALPTDGEMLELEPDMETTEQLIDGKERFSDFIKVFLKMPDNYRDVLRLRCVFELSAEETARLLGTNANTVNIRLTRARKILKTRHAVIASLFAVCGVGLVGLRTWNLLGPGTAGNAAPAAFSAADVPAAAADTPATDTPETTDSGSGLEAMPRSGQSAAPQNTPSRSYTVTGDTSADGLRTLLLQTEDTSLKLYIADSKEALEAVLPASDYDAEHPLETWHTASGDRWISLRMLRAKKGDGIAVFWKAGGTYRAVLPDSSAVSGASLQALLRDAANDYLDFQ